MPSVLCSAAGRKGLIRVFSRLFDRVIRWSRHPRAPWFLGGLSFAESSFFPIPPDVMLVPMVLARPERGWWLAGLTTVTSVLGGVAGFAIGALAMDVAEPWIRDLGYWAAYQRAQGWFTSWGIWAVLLAGFSPVPYKIFTVAAGAMSMSLAPFVIASAVGRGGRFFLVAAIIRLGGPAAVDHLRRYIDIIGWGLVVAGIVAYFFLRG